MTTIESAPALVVTGETRMLIDGQLVESSTGKLFDNVNPATEEVIGQVADASVEDMRRAIAAARRAFDETDWATNKELRKRCLTQLAQAIQDDAEQFRQELVAEVGCPVMSTYGPQLDVPIGEQLQWAAAQIDEFPWERQLPNGTAFGGNSWRTVVKEPIGVVAAIVPWNYPLEITISKIGPALATGNTVILKPAPDTPFHATHLGRLVAEKTDFPPGVLQVVTTSDNAVAEELVVDPRVDMVSFTGSTATGRRVMEKGAPLLKRFFLELGGKSAHIVLDDADFNAVLPMAAGICFHAGQACAAYSRLLIPRARYEEAVELLGAVFGMVPYGDPTDPNVIQGPQVSKKQQERVLGYIEKGVAEGARLVTGGKRPAHLEKGWFVEPTLFADVTNDMTIAREEIFGPVLVLIPYDSDDEAVRIANDSEYGLSAAVSGSPERAAALAAQLRTGTVVINGGIFYGPDAPFGGYKASGIGRMYGLEGFEQHLETKTLSGPAGT
jgi:aldehyde dehydrogenase (NAD+)